MTGTGRHQGASPRSAAPARPNTDSGRPGGQEAGRQGDLPSPPDRTLLLVAAAVLAGAYLAHPVPPPAVVAVLAVAGAVAAIGRSGTGAGRCGAVGMLLVAVAFVASALGARAWEAVADHPTGPVAGTARLVTDPEAAGRSVRAEVRLQGRRMDAWFQGSAAGAVRPLLAGDGVTVTGRVAALDPVADRWLAVRHVTGTLTVDEVGEVHRATGPAAMANRLRRLLAVGASPLGDDERSLYLGVLVGDDREQSALVADDFRAAGLTHLLAVSGQNVALVLLVADPVLRRRGLTGRLGLTLCLLGFFALVTRFEPSVLRATTMAAVAATGTALGRPSDGLRALAGATTVLVLVDPLLAHALGFQLSVMASGAILVLGGRLAALLPGPRLLTEALAVTLAAQVGVLPLLVATFGGVPLATVPANVLAGPAVGPLATWGMTAGLVAGLVGEPTASVLAVPSQVLASWILAVARTVTALRLGEVGASGGVALLVGAGVVIGARGRRNLRWLGSVGWLLVATVPLVALVDARSIEARHQVVATGVEVWRLGDATVVAVGGSVRTAEALAALRRAGVGSVELLVVADGGGSAPDVAQALIRRYRPAHRWVTADAPAHLSGTTPAVGSRWSVGAGLVVTVEAVDPVVRVAVTAGAGSGTGVPPGVASSGPVLGSPGAPSARAPPL